WNGKRRQAALQFGPRRVLVRRGEKRVEVDKATQELVARQGGRIVMKSHISTGIEGHNTPLGVYGAGPMKRPIHRSKLYHFVPMPWAVQVEGNVFIHGFQTVPRRPSSHGCIRLSTTHGNPARWFYDWIDIGTPIS